MIIDHTSKAFRRYWSLLGDDMYNGAYYYSQELVSNIIPNIKTDRNWQTVDLKCDLDYCIVFVHNNVHLENYDYLLGRDAILVCGIPESVDRLKEKGHKKVIYLPLSIDVEYVKTFKVPKEEQTKEAAFAGRRPKRTRLPVNLPDGIDYLENMPRFDLLQEMRHYKKIYAVGRTALEAKVLGCKLGAYDERFPKTSIWKVLDNKEAAKILQKELDKIDTGREPKIINHEHQRYIEEREACGPDKWNGAYYYSVEICENIIPNVKTDRNWMTVQEAYEVYDHSIVFVHTHAYRNPNFFRWMAEARFNDLVFICSEEADIENLEAIGRYYKLKWKGILLPLSVDVEYVKQFKKKKTKETAFCGRRQRQEGQSFPEGTDFICNLPREELLSEMAKYKKVYATDRVAIEAKILECEILPFDPRHPGPDKWKVLDNKDAAKILQEALDTYDNRSYK